MSDVVQTIRGTLDVSPGPVLITGGQPPAVILAPVNLEQYNIKTFSMKNAGPTALQVCKIQATRVEVQGTDAKEPKRWAPSTTDTDWEDVDTSTFATLANGAFKSVTIKDDVRRWYRMIAQCVGGNATVTPYVAAG